MKTGIRVCAVLALGSVWVFAPVRAEATCGMGLCFDTCQAGPTLFAYVATVPTAGATVPMVCNIASLPTAGTEVTKVTFSVTGGTLPNGTATQDVTFSPAVTTPTEVQLDWHAPAAAGTYTISCRPYTAGNCIYNGGTSNTYAATAQVSIAAAPVPIVMGMTGPTSALLVGIQGQFQVTANDGGGGSPLVYAWSATGGTVTGNGATATWSSSTAGTFTVSVVIRNQMGGETTASLPATATLALSQGGLATSMEKPRRLATGPEGELYVVDGYGQLWMLTARGDLVGKPALPEPATAVAAGAGQVLVTTQTGKLVTVDQHQAKVLQTVSLRAAYGPNGVAWDATRGLLWMAEYQADQLRAVRLDGTTAVRVRTAGATALKQPLGVAVDPAAGVVYLVHHDALAKPTVHAFTPDGNWLRSFPAAVASAGGIGVGPEGRLFVTDGFNGQVKVLSPTGAVVDTLGSYGPAAGQLKLPEGVAFLKNGDIVVANKDNNRLERYGTGVDLPACDVGGKPDSDCDGLPDWWEIVNALNPNWAGDALLDLDGDGLNNLQEFALGTRARLADSDGDGLTDGEEVAMGKNPLDPNDSRPVMVASNPPPGGPGLVRFGATVSSQAACGANWKQTAGPAVLLRGADGLSPSFVARKAATYAFQGKAICGRAVSDPVTVQATVQNVAPAPDAGRVSVVSAGRWLVLDGALSSDANGDALTLGWDQTLGPAVAGATAGAVLPLKIREPGLYAFQLTAADAGGLAAAAEVPVLVLGDGDVAPTAVVQTPLAGAPGTFALDASASVSGGAAAFAWRQVGGPAVVLAGPDQALASFEATQPGHYAFEVDVTSGGLRSPPARVDAYVAQVGGTLPQARVTQPAGATVGEPLALDGRDSTAGAGGALAFSWRQVDGPAAGLGDASAAVATAVPFAPGTYVFDLSVSEGDVAGIPARVRFEAVSAGRANPVAVASAPAQAVAGSKVRLDGRASTGKRYRWTQVSGPWVALDDASSATPTFRPRLPGAYAFELEVEDGSTRSAPAQVGITVLSGQGK